MSLAARRSSVNVQCHQCLVKAETSVTTELYNSFHISKRSMYYVGFRLFRQIALAGGFSTRRVEEQKNIPVVLHKLGIILKQIWVKQEENPILDRFVGQIKIKKATIRYTNCISKKL